VVTPDTFTGRSLAGNEVTFVHKRPRKPPRRAFLVNVEERNDDAFLLRPPTRRHVTVNAGQRQHGPGHHKLGPAGMRCCDRRSREHETGGHHMTATDATDDSDLFAGRLEPDQLKFAINTTTGASQLHRIAEFRGAHNRPGTNNTYEVIVRGLRR